MLRLLLLLLGIVGVVVLLAAVTSKLYRIPTPSMEATLHCAKPTAGCRADESDRIAVSRVVYKVRDPRRGDVVAYRVPTRGAVRCGAQPGGTFVHRIVAIPGDTI